MSGEAGAVRRCAHSRDKIPETARSPRVESRRRTGRHVGRCLAVVLAGIPGIYEAETLALPNQHSRDSLLRGVVPSFEFEICCRVCHGKYLLGMLCSKPEKSRNSRPKLGTETREVKTPNPETRNPKTGSFSRPTRNRKKYRASLVSISYSGILRFRIDKLKGVQLSIFGFSYIKR